MAADEGKHGRRPFRRQAAPFVADRLSSCREVVALADSASGFDCLNCLPAGASGFTTAELKANFLGTSREGGVRCTAHLVHGGRTTQVWDAVVTREADGKAIALFRCTQILLYAG
jgi:1,4-dihydroxy-2-naphthoyl-CoA hydrolase